MLLFQHSAVVNSPFESIFFSTPPLDDFGLSFRYTKTDAQVTSLIVIGDGGRWPVWHISANSKVIWHTPVNHIPLQSTTNRVVLNRVNGKVSLYVNNVLSYTSEFTGKPQTWGVGSSPYMQGTAVYGGARIWDVELRTTPIYSPTVLDTSDIDLSAIDWLVDHIGRMHDPALIKLDVDNLLRVKKARSWPSAFPAMEEIYRIFVKHLPLSALTHYKTGINDELLGVCPAAEAKAAAARVCEEVANTSICGSVPGELTVSLGIGVGGRTLPVLFALSGMALGKAKSDGKNCVRVCDVADVVTVTQDEVVDKLTALVSTMADPALIKVDIDRLTAAFKERGWPLCGVQSNALVADVLARLKACVPDASMAFCKSDFNDELLALCPAGIAKQVAEEVCLDVAKSAMIGCPPGTFTVSIGVGTGARTMPTLFALAGKALSCAKSEGKNCVRVCGLGLDPNYSQDGAEV